MFGNPEITPGGKALKYYSTQRISVRSGKRITSGEVVIGSETNIKVIKNKIASPFQECNLDLIYGKGFNRYGDILDLAVEKELIEKAGSWYSYKGNRIGQGKPNASKYLQDDEKLYRELSKKILSEAKNVSTRNDVDDRDSGDGK